MIVCLRTLLSPPVVHTKRLYQLGVSFSGDGGCFECTKWRQLYFYNLEQVENFDWETPWPCMSITYLKVSKLECCLAAIICFFRVGSENVVQLASRYLERDRHAKPCNLEGRHGSGKSFSLVPWLASAWSDTHFFFPCGKSPSLLVLFERICLSVKSCWRHIANRSQEGVLWTEECCLSF